MPFRTTMFLARRHLPINAWFYEALLWCSLTDTLTRYLARQIVVT
jgi:hypothetical protein